MCASQDLNSGEQILSELKEKSELIKRLIVVLDTLEASSDLIDVGYSIAVSRTVNLWLLKLMKIINVDDSSMEHFFRPENLWFSKLLDVIKHIAMNNYKYYYKK